MDCGKLDFWCAISKRPTKKKHPRAVLSQVEIQAKLNTIKTPKGWTLLGTILDDAGTPALWFGKGKGKARKHQTISIQA